MAASKSNAAPAHRAPLEVGAAAYAESTVVGSGGFADPLHVAIIMDGNGRWATQKGWPRLVGHRRGAERVRQIVRACPGLGIGWLTTYAFSTENWKRSREEVLGLMGIFARYIQLEASRMGAEGVRMRFIGNREPLNKKLRYLMDDIEAKTETNNGLNLTVAINYGGRDEILRAARAVAARVVAGEDVTEQDLSAAMDTSDIPDPDLVIRTSGEMRSSNFMPWQAAYAEYEFTPTLWPDFTPDHLAEIVGQYRGRTRRFGGV